jgi:6-phosphofructokinase
LRIAIVHVGAPAGGMNAATRTAVRLALNRGHTPLAIYNGFSGLLSGDIRPLSGMDVEGWSVEGGSQLGTNRAQPTLDMGLCAYQLQRQGIQALILVGGFESYTALISLAKARTNYPALCIPMVQIPATVSNNVPGTEHSIGSDTALNVIVEAADRIKQSAFSSRKRVFVVEVQGGHCGYLATLGGLASGATCAYIPEEGLDLATLARDAAHLTTRFRQGQNEGRLVFRNESVSTTYTTDVISSIFREEGRGVFDARSSILGHIQQGGAPSPLDRIRATRMAVRSIHWIESMSQPSPEVTCAPQPGKRRMHCTQPHSAAVIGIQGTQMVFTPVAELEAESDFKNRRWKDAWWLELNKLIRVLAKYDCPRKGPLV